MCLSDENSITLEYLDALSSFLASILTFILARSKSQMKVM